MNEQLNQTHLLIKHTCTNCDRQWKKNGQIFVYAK